MLAYALRASAGFLHEDDKMVAKTGAKSVG
jgi:hypothetical protein